MAVVSTAPTATRPASRPVQRSAADDFMRRLLRVDDSAAKLGEEELRRGFSQSMMISGVRCLFTYLLIPFLGPIIGLAAGVGPVIGVAIGALAIGFNIKSMRRFWRADHKYRWHYTIVGGTVIVMLSFLIVADLVRLIG